MTLYEFNLLPQTEKLHFVLQKCTFLAAHTPDDTYKSCLYHARGSKGEFFIEVFYNTVLHDIEYWRTFQTHRLLEPYLNAMNGDDLLRKAQE
jgi:hypothetical protein